MDEKMRKYRRGLWAIVCAGILLAASAGVARPVHTEKEVAVAGAGIFLLVVAATGIALCSKT